jgi:hypothetical protein
MLALLLLAIVPAEPILVDHVDLVELNHFYDEQGRLVFDQVIFYNWSPAAERFQVVDWRLVKDGTQLPAHDWRQGCYVATWQDGEVLRRVTAASYRETWTQYDPELVEREHLPKDARRKLTRLRPCRSQPSPSPQP